MPASTTTSPVINRSSGFAGIVAGVLFVASLSTSKLPGGNDTPDDVIRYFGSRGHQVTMLVSAYLMAAAGIAFAWFLVGLLRRLQADGDPSRAGLMFTGICGATAATMLLLAGGTFFAVPGPLLFENGATAGPATVAAGTVGIGVVVVATLAAGATILAASIVGRRTALLPAWNVRIGYVCGVALIATSVLYLTMALLTVWLVATGIVLARSPRSAASPTPTRSTASVTV